MDGSAFDHESTPFQSRAKIAAAGRLLGIDPDNQHSFGPQEIDQPIKRCLQSIEGALSPIGQSDVIFSASVATVRRRCRAGKTAAVQFKGQFDALCASHDDPLRRREQWNANDLLAEISTAQSDITSHSAAALAQICRAVITGEGPTVAGRVHFSRTLDADDAALCARILIHAGQKSDPVSRAEADALFDINAAGGERCGGGCFDDLLAKAVTHHVMSSCGRNVPRREIALAAETSMEGWTSVVEPDADVRSWLDMRLRELSPSSIAARAIAKAISGTEPPDSRKEVPIGALFDLAA
jgi:hypothetical protein